MPATKSDQLKVRVRMYRQGLGDCFLISFYKNDIGSDTAQQTAFHMLIDCGVLDNSAARAARMVEVAENIRDETGSHINLLVATHRHWDHLSGFLQAQHIFGAGKMKIDRIWASWTEDEHDEQAKTMWKSADTSFAAIRCARQLITDRSSQALWDGINALLGFSGSVSAADDVVVGGGGGPLVSGGKGVLKDPKGAMEFILKQSIRDPEFLEPQVDTAAAPKEVPGLDGVRFYVLGPPRDATYLGHFDPRASDPKDTIYGLTGPSFASSFIAAMRSYLEDDEKEKIDPDQVELHLPFDHRYGYSPGKLVQGSVGMLPQTDPLAKTCAFYAERYARADGKDAWRQIDNDWVGAAGELALWLNSVVNNTSLALAIELVESKKVLLFVADAQIGNWQSWGKLSWIVREANGDTKTLTVDDLFRRTVLYKVGHHGSHNATLNADGLSKMTSEELVAMIPVDTSTARKQPPHGWQMPAGELRKELRRRTKGRVLQADLQAANATLDQAERQERLSPALIAAFDGASPVRPLWIDFVLVDEL